MGLSERFRAWRLALGQRILFSWIRPTFLGCNDELLGIDADDFVVYVLPFRSLTDLLVADKACQEHGLPRPLDAIPELEEERRFFFLNHPEGALGRRSQRAQSPRMLRLFEHQTEPGRTIKIVPVSFFWGHQPDREKSVFKLILSENWSVTNRFKKALAILFHPNHILVEFGQPLRLDAFTSDEADDPNARERQVRRLRRVLRVHFNQQRQAILGPDLSHRRTLINTILESREVVDAIDNQARRDDVPIAKIQARAHAYAQEIASDQSYRVIRFFHVLLTWLWNNLYNGINVSNIERVKTAAQANEIIYIPCHRSHIDYLLLSYVLYHNGLTPPHIAAGKNLNLPVAGTLLRRAGAFFMRRSFAGDALYKAVFDEYLHQMFIKGYSVEYFIEGGRSRTGRTLNPRTGMLSMTVRSFQRDASKPICLMPVYFGYERVLESSTYMNELAGEEKKSESIFDVFKIFGSFKHDFGKVTVNFGEPLMLAEFLDEALPGWQDNPDHPGLSGACNALARELAGRINSAAAVTNVALVATALLSTPRQTIEAAHLENQVGLLQRLAVNEGFSHDYTVCDEAPAEIVADAIKIAGLHRVQHDFGVTVSAGAGLAILLTYYRNNVAHLYAMPSLLARFLRQHPRGRIDTLLAACQHLYPFVRTEYFLPHAETDLNDRLHRTLDFFAAEGLINRDDEHFTLADPASEAFASLTELGDIIEPTLERFLIVCSLLREHRYEGIRKLEADAAIIGQRLSAIYKINSPEFFDRAMFVSFVEQLRASTLLGIDAGYLSVDDRLQAVVDTIGHTLPPDVRFNVLQAVASLQKDVEAA